MCARSRSRDHGTRRRARTFRVHCSPRGRAPCTSSPRDRRDCDTRPNRRPARRVRFEHAVERVSRSSSTYTPGMRLCREPLADVLHDRFLADVVERIVEVALVELQRLVRRPAFVELLAALGPRDRVLRAMDDEQWHCEQREVAFQPLVGAHHLGHSLGGLHFVREQRVVDECLGHLGIAREILFLQLEHVRMGREMRESLEYRQREVRRRHAGRRSSRRPGPRSRPGGRGRSYRR